jgi:hypothetical protein
MNTVHKRMKYLMGALIVTALALLASAATPPRAEALILCNQIFCNNSSVCNVPACGDVGFCSNHHCVPL